MAEYATVAGLVKAGKLRSGTKLHHKPRPNSYLQEANAVVRAGGIEINGQLFPTPTQAAKVCNGGRPVDGWGFWRLPNGEYLGSLREGWISPSERAHNAYETGASTRQRR